MMTFMEKSAAMNKSSQLRGFFQEWGKIHVNINDIRKVYFESLFTSVIWSFWQVTYIKVFSKQKFWVYFMEGLRKVVIIQIATNCFSN